MNKVWSLILIIILSGCANTANDHSSDLGDIWTDMKTISGPKAIIKITPRYPEDLIQRNLSGIVQLAFVVGEDGKPMDIKSTSDASDELIKEATYTLSKNMYHPKYSGQKVVVEAIFHLTKN